MSESTGSSRSMWTYLLRRSDCSRQCRSLVLRVAAITVLTLPAWAGGAYAAIGFVQGGYATPQTPQSTVSVTFTSAQTAGHLNVVVVGWNDTTAAVSSVTARSTSSPSPLRRRRRRSWTSPTTSRSRTRSSAARCRRSTSPASSTARGRRRSAV